jgi:hypothetical protein
MDLPGFFIENLLRFQTLLVSLVGGLYWSHTQASKPLVINKNTLELPKLTIVMQFNDNNNTFGGFTLDVFIQNRLLPCFARTFLYFARSRTLPWSSYTILG